MSMPLDSATPISYKRWILRQSTTYSVFIWHFYPEIRHISVSGLLDLISWKTRHVEVDTFHQIWRGSDHPLPRYDTFTSNTWRYIVTLTIDLLTLNGCRKFFVTWSNPPPTLSILRPSVLELRCSHSDSCCNTNSLLAIAHAQYHVIYL